MKKVKSFLISLVTLVSISVGFSSCGGGIQSKMKVVDEDSRSCSYTVSFKNISDKTINGSVKIKIKYDDGPTKTEVYNLTNFEGGEIQKISFPKDCRTGVDSWSFVN